MLFSVDLVAQDEDGHTLRAYAEVTADTSFEARDLVLAQPATSFVWGNYRIAENPNNRWSDCATCQQEPAPRGHSHADWKERTEFVAGGTAARGFTTQQIRTYRAPELRRKRHPVHLAPTITRLGHGE